MINPDITCQVWRVCCVHFEPIDGEAHESNGKMAAAIACEPGTRGIKEWVDLDGTVICRHALDGRAEVEEFNVESRDKKMHIHGLALRFYNPTSHQWSIWWANAKDGAMYPPPVVGEFKNGRGEFYDQEVVNGRTVFSRYVWTAITSDSPHFEQSISSDGGKTWEPNWVTDQTKDKP